MQLETLLEFQPQKHAFFLNSETPLLKAHESTDYLAFATRSHELILHNTKTGRSVIVYRSDHGFVDIQFTNEHLLAVQLSVHQILVFSLKNEKLKKRITGHQSQITKLSYCRQLFLIASISHDQCIVFNEKTFLKEKTLKCSTSSFIDCSFSMTGNVLTTVFKDGTIFVWNPEDYSHTQNFLPQRALKASLNYGSVLAIYNTKALYLADLNKQVIILQQIDKFWQGNILQVNFLEEILLINTDKSFYLVQISLEHKFVIHNIKQMKGTINLFTIAEYQSILVLLSKKLRKITINKVSSSKVNIIKQHNNPLTNEGLVCAGGYSNSEGCFAVNNLYVDNNYEGVTQQVEKINKLTYQNINTNFSLQKLRQFVRKHHFLPDKHRPMAYRYLLQLPISPEEFRKLESKGRHSCTDLLDSKYPLKNLKLRETMKDILSLLAHYNPVFAQAENICEIIFPFVCLFGNDLFLCFEILYSLFTRQLSFLFEEFPVANSAYLQNMYEILNNQDRQLVNHLKATGMSFTKLSWSLLSSLFATNLPREHLLTIIDSLLVRPNEPEYLMFICLGYLIYNKPRILSIKSDAQLKIFLEQEHTIHIAKYLAVVDKIYNNQRHNVRYDFKMTSLGNRRYEPMCQIPEDALVMHQNKRKLLSQQLQKRKEEQIYRDKMLQQMQNMAIKAKREAERQMIQKQSYELHCQNQSNNKLIFVPTNDGKRIVRIQRLIDELSQALENQSSKKQLLRNYMPAVTNLEVKTNEELQILQNKLANLLTEVKPGSYVHSFKNQPFAIGKQNISDHNAFKANINTQLANNLWSLQNQTRANQNQKWQNNILYSINK